MAGCDLRLASQTLMERGYKRNDIYKARTNVQRFFDDMMSEYEQEDEDDE